MPSLSFTTTLDGFKPSRDAEWRRADRKDGGEGKILFSALRLEVSDNLDLLGNIDRYALKTAGVVPVYSTTLIDPGVLIAPTVFPAATLYAHKSESNWQQATFDNAQRA